MDDDIQDISLRQAIEYLAFDWKAYNNEETEILNNRNRTAFFQETSNALFEIKQSAIKLKNFMRNGQLSFETYIDEEIDLIEAENALKAGKISNDDYAQCCSVTPPSNVMVCRHIFGQYNKTKVMNAELYGPFELKFCEDLNYYINPYKYKISEYDLFYIKVCNARYLDVSICFHDLQKLKNEDSILKAEIKDNKENLNSKILKYAKELKKEAPAITQNKAKDLIVQYFSIAPSRYPSDSQIRRLIKEIFPPQKLS